MPVQNSDSKLYLSDAGHGGALSSEEVDGFNVFGSFSGSQTQSGETRYACLYVRNNSLTTTAQDVIAFLANVTSHQTVSTSIGLGTAVKNEAETELANNNTPPAGVTFTQVVGESGAVDIGDLAVGQYKSIWLRMVVPAGTSAKNVYSSPVTISASTGE